MFLFYCTFFCNKSINYGYHVLLYYFDDFKSNSLIFHKRLCITGVSLFVCVFMFHFVFLSVYPKQRTKCDWLFFMCANQHTMCECTSYTEHTEEIWSIYLSFSSCVYFISFKVIHSGFICCHYFCHWTHTIYCDFKILKKVTVKWDIKFKD